MKRIFAILLLTLAAAHTHAQDKDTWSQWKWLIGEWSGEGSGLPGAAKGTFSFKYDLDAKVLVRKSHTAYPATKTKPASVHDDLMIIYPDNAGKPVRAIYFDNEGHTINYNITYVKNAVVLNSERTEGAPLFKLSYNLLPDGRINTKFEMSEDGVKYLTYVEGKSSKMK